MYAAMQHEFYITPITPGQEPPTQLRLMSETTSVLSELVADLFPEVILYGVEPDPTHRVFVLGGMFALLLWRVAHGAVALLCKK